PGPRPRDAEPARGAVGPDPQRDQEAREDPGARRAGGDREGGPGARVPAGPGHDARRGGRVDRGPSAGLGGPGGPPRARRGALEVSRELRYERLIQASPARVFDLFTSPAGQREFYGNDAPGWVVDSRCELRVGGAWQIVFGPSPGELYRHRHVFE